jgi:hypothetical protein
MASEPRLSGVLEAREWLKVIYAALAGICILSGLILVAFLVVVRAWKWTEVLPIFIPFFLTALVMFLVSSFLTARDLKTLKEVGIIPGVKEWGAASGS